MAFQSIDQPIHWLFLLHALAGALALLVFSIPLFARKGGRLHVKVGWVYIGAMVFVGMSAFVITPWRYFFDPARTSVTEYFALFLFFISILTLSSIWFGLVCLKDKKRTLPSRAFSRLAPPVILILAGIVTQIVGYLSDSSLLTIFPLVGYGVAAGQLKYWMIHPTEKQHWWYAHMQGMGVACIATVTAFLVTALPRFFSFPIARSPILWVAPGIIGGTILNRFTARYRRQFETRRSSNQDI